MQSTLNCGLELCPDHMQLVLYELVIEDQLRGACQTKAHLQPMLSHLHMQVTLLSSFPRPPGGGCGGRVGVAGSILITGGTSQRREVVFFVHQQQVENQLQVLDLVRGRAMAGVDGQHSDGVAGLEGWGGGGGGDKI